MRILISNDDGYKSEGGGKVKGWAQVHVVKGKYSEQSERGGEGVIVRVRVMRISVMMDKNKRCIVYMC